MYSKSTFTGRWVASVLFLLLTSFYCHAQMMMVDDAVTMKKKEFCLSANYQYQSWAHYWEGILLRTNQNLGRFKRQEVLAMMGYGITRKLNVYVSAPYVWTASTAGHAAGHAGVQDIALDAKYQVFFHRFPYAQIRLFAGAGFSTPLTNYIKDYLPYSIGLGATTGTLRAIADIQTTSHWYLTATFDYSRRSDIRIDRYTYYADQQYNTNRVLVPDAVSYAARGGYRTHALQAEIFYQALNSLSGNDIRRGDLPFPTNKMESSALGLYAICRCHNGLGFFAESSQVLAGRNLGKTLSLSAGVQYLFNIR